MKIQMLSMSIAFCLIPVVVLAQEPDEEPLRVLSAAFVRAWNKQDAEGAAAHYASDAIFTGSGGETVRGREAIQKALGGELGRKRKLTLSADEYRWLSQDAVVWRCEWKSTGGGVGASRGTRLAVLALVDGRWQIVEDLEALSPEVPAAAPAHPHQDGDHAHGEEAGHDHGAEGHGHDH